MHQRVSESTAFIIPESIYLAESGYAGEKQHGLCRYFYKISIDEMNSLREKNLENIAAGKPIQFPKNKVLRLE